MRPSPVSGPPMQTAEITVKSALIRSRIPGVDYVINPYLGCGHGCKYCYAVFMKKYARRLQGQAWGSFVEAKVNIAQVLRAVSFFSWRSVSSIILPMSVLER